MSHDEFALSRDQRDEILKAVKAIENQVRQVVGKSDWQSLYVIGTNLTLIRLNVLDMRNPNAN